METTETKLERAEADSALLACRESYREVDRGGRWTERAGESLHECNALVCLDSRPVIRLACTPTDLTELAVGRLVTAGLARADDDVRAVSVQRTSAGYTVNVEYAARRGLAAADPVSWELSAGPGHTLLEAEEASPLRPLDPHLWCVDDVFALCDQFSADTPLHRRTSGTHSCRLALEGRLVYLAEDIGRHNALDKTVGHLALHGLDPARAMLFTSGRIPCDMACKAIRAGIPVLASKAAPTDEAVDLARRYGLVLICKADGDRLKVFSGASLAY